MFYRNSLEVPAHTFLNDGARLVIRVVIGPPLYFVHSLGRIGAALLGKNADDGVARFAESAPHANCGGIARTRLNAKVAQSLGLKIVEETARQRAPGCLSQAHA